jgi:hypothetical protein
MMEDTATRFYTRPKWFDAMTRMRVKIVLVANNMVRSLDIRTFTSTFPAVEDVIINITSEV